MLGLDDPSLPIAERNIHRKVWEYSAIAEALSGRHVLGPGKKGLGFAVGREPLISLFAGMGANVLATDTPDPGVSALWKSDNQHASSATDLLFDKLIDRDSFEKRVQFEYADMRQLEKFEPASFDFIWSACALEHLGSLEAGHRFIRDSATLLRAGGVAAHTTEYNVFSDDDTLLLPNQVIYRRRDIKAIAKDLAHRGFRVGPIDFDSGNHKYDLEFDLPPWCTTGRKHVKLKLGPFIATSILLILERPSESGIPRRNQLSPERDGEAMRKE